MHFDRQENWSCTPGSGIDIGIVATHEFGHAIGLGHETTNTAVMNPSYNSGVTVPLADDINGASAIYGSPPLPSSSRIGDFDGDGKIGRHGVSGRRTARGTSSNQFRTTRVVFSKMWGQVGDIPVPGDYDGDGKSDVAIFRPSTGTWYLVATIPNRPAASYVWGGSSDVVVPRDYDGDGRIDIAVYRPSTGFWYVLFSSTNFTTAASAQWGVSTDIPVPGDYDGDRKGDVAIYRPSTGAWYVLPSPRTLRRSASSGGRARTRQ